MDIVITGMGLVTPLGVGLENVWSCLIAGQSGIRHIQGFNADSFSSRIAGQIPDLETHLTRIIDPKEAKKMGRFIKVALLASDEALAHANWTDLSQEQKARTGVYVGSGIGGLNEIDEASKNLNANGRVTPFFVPSALVNLTSGQIAIKHDLKGPNMAVATACTSGSHAIGEGARMIAAGQADVMVVGGTEAAICPLGMAGFTSMRALSTDYNDQPEKASRPWDKQRDGFVMGEGAGILILESLAHAKGRGAKIYAKLVGYGLSCDAHHIAQPLEDGSGARASMIMALDSAGMKPESIGYINAHATSTPLGDKAELKAIESIFPAGTAVSSTKSAIGHLLGAAGAVEAIFSILSLRDQILPPTLNLDDPEITSMDLIGPKAEKRLFRAVLSNSFGFGGTNATLIFQKIEGAQE